MFLYGGVGGVAIHVGVGGREAIDMDAQSEEGVVVVSGVIVSSVGVTEENAHSLWICEDKLVVGVQIGEAAIEGKGKNAHIPTLFGDWGWFSRFSNMEVASSSAIWIDDCSNDLESLRRNRGEVEVRHGEAIFAGGGCGGSTW